MPKTLFLLGLCVFTTMTYANDLAPKRTETGKIQVDKDYRLEGDVGYLVNESKSSSGSSTKENLTLRLLYQRQAEVWGQELFAEAVSTNDNNSSNNIERYLLSGKLLHRSTDTVYQFAKIGAEKDLSSAFDYQLSMTGGVGKDIVKNDQHNLSAEIGAGYRYSQENEIPNDSISELIATVATFYQYQINSSVRFNQDLSYAYGDEAQTFRSRTALSADLTKNFAAVASYNLKNSHADAGNSRDSLLSLGLRYKH